MGADFFKKILRKKFKCDIIQTIIWKTMIYRRVSDETWS